MKFRFDLLYRALLLALFFGGFWAVWADAQEATNVPPAPAPVPRLVSTNFTAAASDLKYIIRVYSQGHPALEKTLDFLSRHTFLGQPLWKYLASAIFIFLAFYFAKLLDYIVNVWLKRVAAKTETRYDDLVLELLRGPVKVVTFVIFLQIGLNFFDWPDKAQLYLMRGFIVIVACSVTYVLLKIVDLLLGIWREHTVATPDRLFADHLFTIIRKAVKMLVIVVALLLTADNLHINITSLLAGLSVGGLALGLAAQDTVANLFGAVSIFLDKPFHIGDRIKVEGVEGAVESIGLRSTRVRNLDGHHVTIPNKIMGNAIITNITRRPTIKTEMNFGLTYDTPTEKVKRATAVLEEIFRANPKTSDLVISFNKFGDSALNIFVVHTWNGTDAAAQLADLQSMNLEIKKRFDAEQIDFAYPTQTLFLQRHPAK
jgi:MscS family membrane protein